MNEGVQLDWAVGWATTPPQAGPGSLHLSLAWPGREGRAGGELAERCNLSREEFPALPPSFY